MDLYKKYQTFYDKILIREDRKWYTFFDYMMNVHVSPLSSMIVLVMSIINIYNDDLHTFRRLVYLLDFVYLLRMCLKFHLVYVDSGSGMVIRDPLAIRNRYIKSTFWFDLFTVFPIELMVSCFINNRLVENLCVLNRVCRFASLVKYYHMNSDKLTMRKHVKWVYMIYLNLFCLQIMVCLW